MTDLTGRVALVTGAAAGIGRGCAEVLARAGADLIVNDVDERAGALLEEAVRAQGSRVHFVLADVSREDEIARLCDFVRHEFGHLNLLINNAGITLFKTLAATEAEDWDRVVGLDLRGVYLLTRAALPLLQEGGAEAGACVLNIASVHARQTVGDAAAYVAAKGGVVAMTRTLCQELGPFGIRVNSISPGFIRTPHFERWLAAQDDPSATLDRVNSYHPLGRIGTPEDIGYLAAFLASDQAEFITGANLIIDGGLTSRLAH